MTCTRAYKTATACLDGLGWFKFPAGIYGCCPMIYSDLNASGACLSEVQDPAWCFVDDAERAWQSCLPEVQASVKCFTDIGLPDIRIEMLWQKYQSPAYRFIASGVNTTAHSVEFLFHLLVIGGLLALVYSLLRLCFKRSNRVYLL